MRRLTGSISLQTSAALLFLFLTQSTKNIIFVHAKDILPLFNATSSSIGILSQIDKSSLLVKCPSVSSIVVGCEKKNDNNASAAGVEDKFKCKSCVEDPWENEFFVDDDDVVAEKLKEDKEEENKTKHTYLVLLVPPFFGSSVLMHLLSTSPVVSDMCTKPRGQNLIPMQCESAFTLNHEQVLNWNNRWKPDSTNWTRAYEVYHDVGVWRNPNATVLMDKSPPNIAKSASMVEYFESNKFNYRMIVMWRHPCRKQWASNKKNIYTNRLNHKMYMEEIIRNVPKAKRFFINYDDLITRPSVVLRSLLKWFPTLQSLSLKEPLPFNENEMNKHLNIKVLLNPVQSRKEDIHHLRGTTKFFTSGANATVDSDKHDHHHSQQQEQSKKQRSRALYGMHSSSMEGYVFSDKCYFKNALKYVAADELILWERYYKNELMY